MFTTPPSDKKFKIRNQIEHLGASWIAVTANPWTDYNLKFGTLGIDIKSRTATLWGGGNAKICTTTVRRVGEAVAVLLSLPDAELAQFKDETFYVSSFYLTQRELLDASQRATGTTDADWTITTPTFDSFYKKCDEDTKNGSPYAMVFKLSALTFENGNGEWKWGLYRQRV